MQKIKKSIIKFKNLTLGVKIALTLFFLFFVFEAVFQLYPFLHVINNSLKGTHEYGSSMDMTVEWMFVNYLDVFTRFRTEANGEYVYYLNMLWHSIWQTALYLVVNIGSSVLVAYPLAKFRFPGKEFLFGLLIFKQTIPIIGTGAALFRLKVALNMINNPFTIWLQWANGFDYSAFVLYGIFKGISNSYTESAKLDGASDLKVFTKIMLPQAVPVIVALLVQNFVTKWNDYATTQISLYYFPTLAYGLFDARKALSRDLPGIYNAAIVMVSIPGVLLYATMQNLIIKNMAVGGLKG